MPAWLRTLVTALLCGSLVACGGGSAGEGPAPSGPLTLTLPARGVGPAELAVIVAEGDALSEAIGSYYQAARGIPAVNVIKVKLTVGVDAISAADFANLKAELDAKLPAGVQATLLTWSAPFVVRGSCNMSITSAMAFGYDAKYCGSGCVATASSPYFDSEARRPWSDLAIRPSMMLGARSLVAAKALIDRGVAADATYPAGDGYLLRTTDTARSVRYADFAALPARWAGANGLTLNYIDNAAREASNTLVGKSNVLYYFTGLPVVADIASNSYRPGAVADHLTSFGGYLGDTGQMPVTAWLDAGVTGSYGTVDEPCNFTTKFPQASVMIDHYYRGASLIEAYWKSVAWPGQGLFVGEPLARPFADQPSFVVDNGQYLFSTRAMRAGSTYSLEYRTSATGSWVILGNFSVPRPQPQTLRAPVAPAEATELRWVGPCPDDHNKRCTLGTSV